MSLFCESRTRERREADEGWDQEDPTLPMVGLITINIIITSSINGHTLPNRLASFLSLIPPSPNLQLNCSQGWRSKRAGQSRLFISREGNQFMTRRLAIVHMHQQVWYPHQNTRIVFIFFYSLSMKGDVYSQEEISKMRGGLVEEGWGEDVLLPLNWRLETHIHSPSKCSYTQLKVQDVGRGQRAWQGARQVPHR